MTLKLSNEKAIYLEWLKALINMYWSDNDKNLWIKDFVIFKCI